MIINNGAYYIVKKTLKKDNLGRYYNRSVFIPCFSILIMNKLKKLSFIFISITFFMSILSVVTLNGFFIFGGIASFTLSLFYVYLNKARQTFKKDLLENLK